VTDNYLQIGIDINNRLASIYEVETGEQCNCTCPKCGAKLIAKNRNKSFDTPLKEGQKVAHFSHANNVDCPEAQESAVHLIAKKVLSENKRLLIPAITKEDLTLTESRLIEFDEVHTEKYIVNGELKIQPDSTLVKNNRTLLIEFYKSHAVDEDKYNKIEKLNISCIEIDVNGIEPIKDGKINEADVKELLEKELWSKTWIYNSQVSRLYENFLESVSEKETKTAPEEKESKKTENKFEESLFFEKEAKQKWKENWISNLKRSGYDLLKVYEYVRYNYESDYNDNTGRWKTYKSFDSKEENVYCPKEKVDGKNTRIDLFGCELCEFHKNIIYGDFSEKRIACGFRKNLKNPKKRMK